MPLSEYSIEELEQHLEIRKAAKREPPMSNRSIDWSSLRKLVFEYVVFIASDDYHEDNDYKGYIFESALTAIYGQPIWDWINEVVK